MKKRHLLLLFISVVLIFGLLTFFGDKGILHLLRIQKELTRITEMNAKIEEENQKLREEVKRLQHAKQYLEEIARKELGMVKQDEIIYQFEDEKGDRLYSNESIRSDVPKDRKK